MSLDKRDNSRTLPLRAVDGQRKKLMTRRRHQQGQLLELKDGYAVRFYEACDGKRQRVQKFLGTFKELPTLRAAKNVMQAELVRVNQQVTVQRNASLTFRIAATRWLTDCTERKQKPIKASVACNWRGILRNHLLPLVGEVPLEDCGNRTMRSVVERLSKKGLAPQTIHSIALVFKLVVSSVCDEDGNQLYNTKWNARFIDMPAIDAAKQNTPAFTSEQVSKIVAAASGRFQMVAILLAATGLRIGELLGLECRHFDGTSVKVEQSIWNGRAYPPKTLNAFRTVDLVPEVCSLLKSFIGERTTGYIFQTCGRKPLSTVNLLTRDLHPLLDELGISRCGFHAYRRFRNTHLRQSRCPTSILKYWMGHADRDMSALYDKSAEDVTYRRDVCRSMGVGFSLPKTLADGPLKVVLSGVTGVSTETAEVAVHVDSIG